ncbi:hypothetical protein EON73_03565 [bacterium]|nr:MAG: hypothetical protein EON73_03565 [bacterium]
MKRQLTILTAILLTVLKSFGQANITFTKAEHYKTNNFNVAIFPAYSLDMIPGKRFTPTRQEIDKAEITLRKDLKALNKHLGNQNQTPIVHKNLSKYNRQYFGYIDKMGARILLINCFWSKNKDDTDRWLTSRIRTLDGGSYYWNVKFNIDKEELFDLDVNGSA